VSASSSKLIEYPAALQRLLAGGACPCGNRAGGNPPTEQPVEGAGDFDRPVGPLPAAWGRTQKFDPGRVGEPSVALAEAKNGGLELGAGPGNGWSPIPEQALRAPWEASTGPQGDKVTSLDWALERLLKPSETCFPISAFPIQMNSPMGWRRIWPIAAGARAVSTDRRKPAEHLTMTDPPESSTPRREQIQVH